MKILIAGAGDVGLHLCKMFENEKHSVSLIDQSEDRLKIARTVFDGHTYQGSATSLNILQLANASACDLFIAVTNNEFANVTACILAKKMGAKKTLCRIDNHEYLEEDKLDYFRDLGIDYMFYPEEIAATEIVNLIRQSAQSDTLSFGGGKLFLHVVRMEDGNQSGQTLDELYNISRSYEFKVAGIVRDNATYIPKKENETLQPNDLLYTVATAKGVELLKKYFNKKSDQIRSVIILGGSRIGINVARKLAATHTVKLFERDRTKSFEISNALTGVLVVNGDGRNIDLLKREGIEHTDAFVSVTGDAEVNMIACLLAKKMGVKRTIAEIENIDYIRLGENIEIDSIINKKILSANRIFSFTTNDDVSSINCLTCSDAEIIEYIAKPDSPITNKSIAQINLPNEAIIAGIIRGNEPIIPDAQTQIRPFDRVIIFAMPRVLNEVSKLFKPNNRFF
ncbi:MAG TPA: Trk system potassium transporter TrkA [Bacteroidales bacterium]|nr:Trk system potassium transporter TrkA [Bacteroidales bacterium]HOK98606.1 Trk system potassium transporter TrkA [Bacteroidales bacterium]HPO65458.1 Trk system potassium transporter TrkA [Bacteroidales bacterium]